MRRHDLTEAHSTRRTPMVKSRDAKPEQLVLQWDDFAARLPRDEQAETPGQVCASFVDAKTLAVRQEAINRVVLSGIFATPRTASRLRR